MDADTQAAWERWRAEKHPYCLEPRYCEAEAAFEAGYQIAFRAGVIALNAYVHTRDP